MSRMMSIRQVQRWSSRLVSSGRVLSTSSIIFEEKKPAVNVEQAAGGDSSLGLQPLPLKEGLLRKDLDKWDQNQLKEDFEKKTLRGLAKTVEEKEYPGSDFIANVRGLAQDFPNGVESLAAIVNSQLSEQQNRADPDIDFCGNGALLDDGKFY